MLFVFLFSDTTIVHSADYNIGYNLGAWLPFILFAAIATVIIIKKKK